MLRAAPFVCRVWQNMVCFAGGNVRKAFSPGRVSCAAGSEPVFPNLLINPGPLLGLMRRQPGVELGRVMPVRHEVAPAAEHHQVALLEEHVRPCLLFQDVVDLKPVRRAALLARARLGPEPRGQFLPGLHPRALGLFRQLGLGLALPLHLANFTLVFEDSTDSTSPQPQELVAA